MWSADRLLSMDEEGPVQQCPSGSSWLARSPMIYSSMSIERIWRIGECRSAEMDDSAYAGVSEWSAESCERYCLIGISNMRLG
jgi:hypothetical protein